MKLNKIGVIMITLLIVLSGCASKQEELPALDTTYVNTVDGSVRVGKDGAIPLNETELSKVQVDIFFEPACGACLAYGDISRDVINSELKNNTVELVYHPVTFFSEMSPDAYSNRSAAYALAVAEYAPEHALNYFEVILSMDGAPKADDNGLVADSVFLDIMRKVGVSEEQIKVIDERKADFIPMLNKSTQNFLNVKHPMQVSAIGKNGEAYTPLVIVNETGEMGAKEQDLGVGSMEAVQEQLRDSINALK